MTIETWTEPDAREVFTSFKRIRRDDGSVVTDFGEGSQILTDSYQHSVNRTDNPDFLRKIREGIPVLAPYSRSGASPTSKGGSRCDIYHYGGPSYYDHIVIDGQIVDWEAVKTAAQAAVPDLSNQKVIASTSLLSELNGSLANVYVTALEARKTIDLLRDKARSVNALAVDMRRLVRNPKNYGKHRSLGRAVPYFIHPDKGIRGGRSLGRDFDDSLNLWMEARYGWRPLVYDTVALAEATAEAMHGIEDRLRRFKTTSKISDKTVLSDVFIGQVTVPQKGSYDFYGDVEIVPVMCSSLAGALYRVRSNIADARAFGLTDFGTAAWDLVPYSWAVNMFTNVGDFLSSLGNIEAGTKDLSTYLSTINKVEIRVIPKRVTSRFPALEQQTMFLRSSFELFEFEREVGVAETYRGIRLDLNLSPSKVIDLFAVGRNLLKANKYDLQKRLRV